MVKNANQPHIVPRSEHPISRRDIDEDALRVLYQLHRAGHTAYLVGGGVRDLLLGRKPKDFDIVTSARPAQVRRVFRNCRLIGRRFRLAHIHFLDGKIIELSTFRAQPELGDSEADGLVTSDNTFGTPRLDALRRDFTVNSLFYDVSTFSVIDYVGGLEDVRKGVVRTIGDPRLRFQEDPVRMVRAIRFAARLDFRVEAETWKAMSDLAYVIERSPAPRVLEEWTRLLEEGAAARAFEMMDKVGLLEFLEPSMEAYLRLAERGEVEGDDGGDLIFRLLHQADLQRAAGRKLPRYLLFALWCLPLLADHGFFEEEQPDQIFRECALPVLIRLGIARKESDATHDALVMLRRLLERRKKRRGSRPLREREGFRDALMLLKMWVEASDTMHDELERWLPDFEGVEESYRIQPVSKPQRQRDPQPSQESERRFQQRRKVRRRANGEG